jgi:glycosyltransferase involved in cell wall biosynthesis
MKISAIVPAYNEQKNIKRVLDGLQKTKEIKEIIVIDDGSTDTTSKILKKYPDITVITLPQNQGKPYAVRRGVEESKYENILMVDADLFGLNEYYLRSVIETYKDGFDMVLLDYGGQDYKWAIKLTKLFPAFSGVRLFRKKDFQSINFSHDRNLTIETQLNSWFLDNDKKIAVVPGEIVRNPSNWEKHPLMHGVYLNPNVYREMLFSHKIADLPKLWRQWKSLDDKKYTRVEKKSEINVTAIVPAYNEEKNILNVLKCLKLVPQINEIIVIDDGSSDNTTALVKEIENITVLKNKKNLGKTKSVIKGIKASKNDAIVMVDADLVGLEYSHLEEIINTYAQGFDMVILDYGGQEFYLRKIIRSFPALSGVRILSKKVFNKIKFNSGDRFELENRINNYYLENQLTLIVVNGETVHTPHKYNKYTFHKGLYLEAKALKEIFLSEGATNIGKLVKTWWEINEKRK